MQVTVRVLGKARVATENRGKIKKKMMSQRCKFLYQWLPMSLRGKVRVLSI